MAAALEKAFLSTSTSWRKATFSSLLPNLVLIASMGLSCSARSPSPGEIKPRLIHEELQAHIDEICGVNSENHVRLGRASLSPPRSPRPWVRNVDI